MFDDLLRRLKDGWLAPIARGLGRSVPPNAISVLAFAVGLACAWQAAAGHPVPALGLWLVNRVLDGLDGTQARTHGLQSAFGGYLDIVLDFAVYAAIPIGMLLADRSPAMGLATALLLAAFFVNAASWMYLSAVLESQAAGARARGELTTVTMPPGLVAGTETVVLYAIFLAMPSWRLAGFHLMTALVGLTILQRLWWGWRHLRA